MIAVERMTNVSINLAEGIMNFRLDEVKKSYSDLDNNFYRLISSKDRLHISNTDNPLIKRTLSKKINKIRRLLFMNVQKFLFKLFRSLDICMYVNKKYRNFFFQSDLCADI